MERRTQETEIANLKEQILALEHQIQPLSKMICSQDEPISSIDDQQPSTSGNTSKRDTQEVCIKDLFQCSEKEKLEMPHSTEYRRMADSGLGYRFDVKFPFQSATSRDIRGISYREFPRLKEAQSFYVCAKGPGTSTKLCIKNYSVPS
ncbi:hypothetical protein DAPPUDRAFT_112634 [Daphnia pulex]|uniref:Uncharacterized protein n=1 Tax=Daphnia pulex TaxID=6669 RepID=E9HCG5_DAPPU|nr:hypothetical protein DAPPUDRAFT_112634 [Daphnia pulex]|eukprot:EFX70537.1 hypothetical protein DAPPUDRAFT_112634 [Daphnia pulex]